MSGTTEGGGAGLSGSAAPATECATNVTIANPTRFFRVISSSGVACAIAARHYRAWIACGWWHTKCDGSARHCDCALRFAFSDSFLASPLPLVPTRLRTEACAQL